MNRKLHIIALAILILFLMPVGAQAAEFLIPGGQIIGLQLHNGALTVAAFDDVLGSSARSAGFKIGDKILSIDGQPVSCAEDIRAALTRTGSPVTVDIQRSGKNRSLELTPRQTENGPRLGIHLKQGITGIGTVTWYDPDSGAFGTLGHGVSDSGGDLLKMTGGNAYHAQVISVKKGKCGEPGLLKGSAEALGICGSLLKNTPQGVFGVTKQGWQGKPLPVAGDE